MPSHLDSDDQYDAKWPWLFRKRLDIFCCMLSFNFNVTVVRWHWWWPDEQHVEVGGCCLLRSPLRWTGDKTLESTQWPSTCRPDWTSTRTWTRRFGPPRSDHQSDRRRAPDQWRNLVAAATTPRWCIWILTLLIVTATKLPVCFS